MKCLVVKNNEGKIVLEEFDSKSSEGFTLSTVKEHEQIWINNYLNKLVQEDINFLISEEQIEEETFQLIAYPIVNC